MEYKIISVESRKGGVGKTTAALNLANLLIDRGYSVLLLDVDITGTSITGSYDSSFWQGKINPIKQNDSEINLLKIFHKLFLAGDCLPDFSLEPNKKDFYVVKNKINVFNSEIYNDDSTLLCDPRILFDELHSFWLIEMIETLCSSFVSCMDDNKTAIILDNSPGYVGLGKAIHDWLTDLGPQFGKFLTISSLDVQDLNSCLSAIKAIHALLETKIDGARYYLDLISHNDEITELKSKEARDFFFKLANNNVDRNQYEYFKNQNIAIPKLSFYQSLIINKAPREIKSNTLYYDVNKSLKDYEKRTILREFSGEKDGETPRNVVYFDNYIHFQFVEPYVGRVYKDRKREYSSLKGHFTRIENSIIENKEVETNGNYTQFLKMISEYDTSLSKLLVRLSETGFDNIVRLVEERWHPQTPLLKVQQQLNRLIGRFPFIERISQRDEDMYEDYINEGFFDMEFREFISNIEIMHNEEFYMLYDKKKNIFCLETLYFYLIGPYLKQEYPERENSYFKSLLVLILQLQDIRLRRRERKIYDKRNRGFQYFLANENIDKRELRKYLPIIKDMSYKHFEKNVFYKDILYSLEESDDFTRFYNVFCHAQARLIDMNEDFNFLISVLRNVTIDERNESVVIFPNIRDVLDDVIIKKKHSVSIADKRIHKEFQRAEYMSDFREIIGDVLNKWEM